MKKEIKPCWIEKENKICSHFGLVHGGSYCYELCEELTEEEIEKGCSNCEY